MVPTAAFFNQIPTNDASFADGTGISTNAIAAASLATNAITLGYTAITGNFSTASTTAVQITGLTSSVTVPAGNRKVEITLYIPDSFNTNIATVTASIWDGTVGSGTQLATWKELHAIAGNNIGLSVTAVVTPAAGAKTYNAGILCDTGTETVTVSATSPAFLLVKAI